MELFNLFMKFEGAKGAEGDVQNFGGSHGTRANSNPVNFQFKEVRFKEFFRFKQAFHFPKMKK